MSDRRSIDLEEFGHAQPIPAASRIGNIVCTSGVSGRDAEGNLPDDLESQCTNMFANLRLVLEAAGASPDDVIKFTVWIRDRAARDIFNREWLKMFPDEHSRPARHVFEFERPGDYLVQCEVMAVIG